MKYFEHKEVKPWDFSIISSQPNTLNIIQTEVSNWYTRLTPRDKKHGTYKMYNCYNNLAKKRTYKKDELKYEMSDDFSGTSYKHYSNGVLRTKTWHKPSNHWNPLNSEFIKYYPDGKIKTKIRYYDFDKEIIYWNGEYQGFSNLPKSVREIKRRKKESLKTPEQNAAEEKSAIESRNRKILRSVRGRIAK